MLGSVSECVCIQPLGVISYILVMKVRASPFSAIIVNRVDYICPLCLYCGALEVPECVVDFRVFITFLYLYT